MALAVTLFEWALWLLIAAAAVHLARAGIAAWSRPLAPAPPIAGDQLPLVTVQLPLADERGRAEQVMRAAAGLDWPDGRLEVQVLDDSQDDTREIVDRVADELSMRGHAVSVLRRSERRGFKAGALDAGLVEARGEWICVLDADARPPRDLLRRLARPLADDPAVGFAQARWSFDNGGDGLLEEAQALILDGLMLVEQPSLSDRRLPLQFNGTAGMWRRAALDRAGGWAGASSASVTEDLDLSFRARLAGFRGVQLARVVVPTELPSTVGAFRAQQARWVRGGAEVLRGLSARIRSGALPPHARLTMAAHLARHARQPLLALAALWLPAALLGWVRPLAAPPGLFAALLGALGVGLLLYYGAAGRRAGLSTAHALARAVVLAPAIVTLSMGLAPALAAAFLSALAGRRADFVRTPKGGGYRARAAPLAWLEAALGFANLAAAATLCLRGDLVSGFALGAFVASGLLWVGLGTLLDR